MHNILNIAIDTLFCCFFSHWINKNLSETACMSLKTILKIESVSSLSGTSYCRWRRTDCIKYMQNFKNEEKKNTCTIVFYCKQGSFKNWTIWASPISAKQFPCLNILRTCVNFLPGRMSRLFHPALSIFIIIIFQSRKNSVIITCTKLFFLTGMKHTVVYCKKI